MKYAKRMFCIFLSMMLVLEGCNTKTVSENKLNIIDDNYRTYYEVFLYSFYDSDGDGIGDINGLIEKLDYINSDSDKSLGCNGIWLMPIMKSTTYHKYDVVDYYTIDEQYGTMDDFVRLLDECHKRGINLIIDMVFNHTSDEHEWFVNATDYIKSLDEGSVPNEEDNKYFGYYNFKQDINDTSVYYEVGNTGWYYEAEFWDKMPDLNLDNANVRKEFEDIAKYYIDMGVDGFRLDAAKEYFTGSTDKNVEVLDWFNTYVKSVKEDTYVVAEVWDSFATIANYYKSGIDSIFNYAYGNGEGLIPSVVKMQDGTNKGARLRDAMIKVQETFSANYDDFIDASFISNHDNNRSACYVNYDEDLIKLMAGINLMMTGSSFVYYGEEIGMAGSGIDENKRLPMYFSNDDNNIPNSPPNATQKTTDSNFPPVDEQLEDKDSILNYYIRAIRLRNENPEILRGVVNAIDGEFDSDICAITKTYNDSTIAIIYNLSKEEKQVTVSKEAYNYSKIQGYVCNYENESPTLNDECVTIPAYGIVVLK